VCPANATIVDTKSSVMCRTATNVRAGPARLRRATISVIACRPAMGVRLRVAAASRDAQVAVIADQSSFSAFLSPARRFCSLALNSSMQLPRLTIAQSR